VATMVCRVASVASWDRRPSAKTKICCVNNKNTSKSVIVLTANRLRELECEMRAL
jgi:hypothetical protein